jgi:hypothetical protein
MQRLKKCGRGQWRKQHWHCCRSRSKRYVEKPMPKDTPRRCRRCASLRRGRPAAARKRRRQNRRRGGCDRSQSGPGNGPRQRSEPLPASPRNSSRDAATMLEWWRRCCGRSHRARLARPTSATPCGASVASRWPSLRSGTRSINSRGGNRSSGSPTARPGGIARRVAAPQNPAEPESRRPPDRRPCRRGNGELTLPCLRTAPTKCQPRNCGCCASGWPEMRCARCFLLREDASTP